MDDGHEWWRDERGFCDYHFCLWDGVEGMVFRSCLGTHFIFLLRSSDVLFVNRAFVFLV